MAALPNIIKIGDKITPSFEFDNASIAKVNGIFSVDVIGNEMAVDTVTAVVRYTGDGDIRGIATALRPGGTTTATSSPPCSSATWSA